MQETISSQFAATAGVSSDTVLESAQTPLPSLQF